MLINARKFSLAPIYASADRISIERIEMKIGSYSICLSGGGVGSGLYGFEWPAGVQFRERVVRIFESGLLITYANIRNIVAFEILTLAADRLISRRVIR